MSNVGIYMITSPTGRIYIGQSGNLKKRFYDYKISRGVKPQRKLYNSFQKYGFDAHQIVVILYLDKNTTQAIIDYWEKFFIAFYKNQQYKMLNIREGGYRTPLSEETKKRIGIANKGRKKSQETIEKHRQKILGKKRGPLSEATREKIRQKHLGMKLSPESIEKMRSKLIGRKQSEETLLKYRNKIFTEAHRKKISEANKGRPCTEETKLKIGLANKGKKYFGRKLSEEHRAKLLAASIGRKPSPEQIINQAKKITGENSGMSKLTNLQVRIIYHSLNFGLTRRYLSKIFNVDYNSIRYIHIGKVWSTITGWVHESKKNIPSLKEIGYA